MDNDNPDTEVMNRLNSNTIGQPSVLNAPRQSLVRLMKASLVLGLCCWLFVDVPLRNFLHEYQFELLRWITWILGRTGQTIFWVAGGSLLWILSHRHSLYCPRVFRDTVVLKRFLVHLAVALAISSLVVTLIKFGVGRPRPSEYFRSGATTLQPFSTSARFASFPSGHAQTVWAGFATSILFLPEYEFILVLFGILGCIGRVIMLRHYPSDIFFGTIVGIWGALYAPRVIANATIQGWIKFSWAAIIRQIPGRCRSTCSKLRPSE